MTEKKPAFNINRLNSLIKKYSARARTEEPNVADLTALLIHSSLLYDATTEMADTAMQRVRSRNVDFNEFRVNLVEEMVTTIGLKYPDGFGRMRRLRMTLFDLFRRHHRVSLEQLVGKPKRDVRIYLENLEGMRTYAVSRMMLLGFEVALVPIDQTTVDMLVHYEVLPEDMKPSSLTELLQRNLRVIARGKCISHSLLQRMRFILQVVLKRLVSSAKQRRSHAAQRQHRLNMPKRIPSPRQSRVQRPVQSRR